MRLLACIEADLKKQGFISADGEVDRAIQTLRKGPKGSHAISLGTRIPGGIHERRGRRNERWICSNHRKSAFYGRQKDFGSTG